MPELRLGERAWTDNGRAGWTIQSTATHHIDLMPMLFNYRIVMTPRRCPGVWDHGWCYEGGSMDEEDDLLVVTLIHALAWDPDKTAEPFGFFKRACSCPRWLP